MKQEISYWDIFDAVIQLQPQFVCRTSPPPNKDAVWYGEVIEGCVRLRPWISYDLLNDNYKMGYEKYD